MRDNYIFISIIEIKVIIYIKMIMKRDNLLTDKPYIDIIFVRIICIPFVIKIKRNIYHSSFREIVRDRKFVQKLHHSLYLIVCFCYPWNAFKLLYIHVHVRTNNFM